MRCGARRIKAYGLCRRRVTPGKARCWSHGGASTGIKTAEGRERQREAARAWALKRRRDNPGKSRF